MKDVWSFASHGSWPCLIETLELGFRVYQHTGRSSYLSKPTYLSCWYSFQPTEQTLMTTTKSHCLFQTSAWNTTWNSNFRLSEKWSSIFLWNYPFLPLLDNKKTAAAGLEHPPGSAVAAGNGGVAEALWQGADGLVDVSLKKWVIQKQYHHISYYIILYHMI